MIGKTMVERNKETSNQIKSKIMVIDDDPLNILIVKDSLSPELYDLKVYMSGKDALKEIESFLPDIVLLDIMMPVMDGYEVTRKIRERFPDEFIKIILISAKMNIQDRLEGYQSGADDYMTKPYDEGELIAKINVFLKLKVTQDKLKESKNNLEELNNNLENKVQLRTNQLLEAEKLSSIGKYAAGLVHNLNNPLAAVIGYSQLVLNSPNLTKGSNEEKWVKKIMQSSDIMKDIISSILTKGRGESEQIEKEVNLIEVIETQLELLKANTFFKNEVNLNLDLQPIPGIKGVYVHFSQSLGNIINNAIDSMFESKEKILTIKTYVENNFIVIAIKDTGCGIPKEIIDKIYDPFFTTKPLNTSSERPSGTGLGMPSTKQMLEAYQGEIQIESTVGKGTEFKILLPLGHRPINA